MRAPLTGTKRKDGRWQITVVLTGLDGSKHRKTIYGPTQTDVQNDARKLLFTEGRAAKEDHTINELIEVYKAEKWDSLKQGTKEQYGPGLKCISAHMGTELVTDITPLRVTRWLKLLAKDPKKGGRTIQAYRNVLGYILKFARSDLGWVRDIATTGVRLPTGVSAKPLDRPRLSPIDYAQVLAKEPNETLRDLWEFLGETGMRIEEALSLKRDAIFTYYDMWWVRGGMKTEAGRNREIPIPDKLAGRLLERQTWLFPFPDEDQDRPYHYRHCVDLWAAALSRAGVEHTNMHQLRKMAVSRWIAGGLPDDVVKYWAGHSDIRITKNVYNRLGRERLRMAAFTPQSVMSMSVVVEHTLGDLGDFESE